MPKTRRKVNIIGHRNPDTDSICSALAYTYLKNQLGDAVYEARRAGQINRETAFVLKHFGVEPPRLCTDVSPQVRHFMRSKNLLEFSVNTAVEDARKVMANVRHRYFPILDANGKYCGVISRRNLLNVHRKQVIMVDHNERGQAVDGLEQAEILEIIDHHRLGALETAGPVYFRNEPVGCTATIISRMYEEHGVEIPPQIAGLLLSAILSDTLMFRSPTSTPLDQHSAEKLARIAGEEIPTYAEQMFEAGADLTGRTADDVFFSDFKVFSRGDAKFGVGQAIYMTSNSRSAAEALITPFLPEALAQAGVPMVFFMCTDMRAQATDLLFCGQQAEEIVRSAFHVETKDGKAVLPGVVSRKKQLIPPLMAALQALQA